MLWAEKVCLKGLKKRELTVQEECAPAGGPMKVPSWAEPVDLTLGPWLLRPKRDL